jgi:hypothetical protein
MFLYVFVRGIRSLPGLFCIGLVAGGAEVTQLGAKGLRGPGNPWNPGHVTIKKGKLSPELLIKTGETQDFPFLFSKNG